METLEILLTNTPFLQFLAHPDMLALRQTCHLVKKTIDTPLPWVQQFRQYDPRQTWRMEDHSFTCYQPVKKKWTCMHWEQQLPPMVPLGFWTEFWKWFQWFMTVSVFKKWCSYSPLPLWMVDTHKPRWRVGIRMNIMGPYTHDPGFFPEHWRDIDEFISVGVCIPSSTTFDHIMGLNPFSIGWHSDDGNIYCDSLIVKEGPCFGKGDCIQVMVDYRDGTIRFAKNFKLIYTHELSGEALYNPLQFSVVCKTMNHLSFQGM